MRSLAQARAKRVRAIELAIQGLSYDDIAREVGFSHRGSAHRAVHKALAEQEAQGVEELRRIELDRLDRLQASVWDRALAGDLIAVTTVLRVIDQRIRLLGLQAQNTDHHAGPTMLVVGPSEGNPEQATGAG
jgi:hypothetical protein